MKVERDQRDSNRNVADENKCNARCGAEKKKRKIRGEHGDAVKLFTVAVARGWGGKRATARDYTGGGVQCIAWVRT